MPFSWTNFQIELPGDDESFIPEILVYTQALDRYSSLTGISASAVIQLAASQLALIPSGYDGFIVERSDDLGLSWADVSPIIRDSFFYVDIPPAPGVYHYRSRTVTVFSSESAPGNEVPITVGSWDNADILGVSQINSADGVVVDRTNSNDVFPNGLDGAPHEGVSISEGSMAGGYGSGSWYLKSKEEEPPRVYDENPACGSVGVSLPLNIITYKIQDLPYPTGGSGILDSSIVIWLSVTSEFGGSLLKIRDGALQPHAPSITCVLSTGVDPNLDRNVVITTPVGYIKTDDVVLIKTRVLDLEGNETIHECSFTMEHEDVDEPEITNESPECGLGLTATDTRRAARDTAFSFQVIDLDSGVDLSTLQVEYGPDTIGPWTQILQNGSIWLLNFYGSIVSPSAGTYTVVINRPTTDPLWDADTKICFRIRVDDLDGNSAEEICCFQTADCVSIKRVIPIAENILLLEFTSPVKDGSLLRTPSNYVIQPLGDAEAVPVKRVLPQQFKAPVDPEQPTQRLGVGNPSFVYLDTGIHTAWGLYTITTQNLEDQYSLPFCSGAQPIEYRARRTKVDEGRDIQRDINLLNQDSLTRRILIGIQQSDEVIGGRFIPDDWENL